MLTANTLSVSSMTKYCTLRRSKKLFLRACLFLAVCFGNRKSSSQRCLQNTLEIVRRQWKLTLGMVNLLSSSQQLSCGTCQLTCSCSFPSRTWVYESSAFLGRETLKEINKKKNFFFVFLSFVLSLSAMIKKQKTRTDKKTRYLGILNICIFFEAILTIYTCYLGGVMNVYMFCLFLGS